jgi:hypothetical protein
LAPKRQSGSSLQNSSDQPVKALKDYEVELEIRQPSGKSYKQKIKLGTGQTSAKLETTFSEAGLVELRARPRRVARRQSHAQCQNGGDDASQTTLEAQANPETTQQTQEGQFASCHHHSIGR